MAVLLPLDKSSVDASETPCGGVNPASIIFCIPELIELILYYLDTRTLLLASRVNTAFYQIITTSPTLQALLFFGPNPQPYSRANQSIPRTVLSTDSPELCTRNLHRLQLNPLLALSFPFFFPKSTISTQREGFVELPWNKDAYSTAAYVRREASWRGMQLSDPPVMAAHVAITWTSIRSVRTKVAALNCEPNGLKMGVLYDVIQHLVVEKGRFFFAGFDINWGVAEAETEDEWLREQRDWDQDKCIWVEEIASTDESSRKSMQAGLSQCKTSVIRIRVDNLFLGCVARLGPPLGQFKSDAAEEVNLRFENAVS
jgi:hypothetical protein